MIADAPELRDISVLRDATALQRLELADCIAVSDFSVLKGCSLTELDLGGCTQLRDLSFLEGSAKLVKLKISARSSITDVQALFGGPARSTRPHRSEASPATVSA